jgi:ribosomal protein S18 acetylase RimI-like enzyme
VGHRVVVRRRLDDGRATDVLGELISFDEDALVVRTERGEEHRFRRADVEAGKRIGPRPARYSEVAALERVADRAWPAPVHEPLGEWALRAAEGWTNRANSALPLGDPGRPLPEAIEACHAWYRERGLLPRITVPLPLRRDVVRELHGWTAQPLVLVQAAALDQAEAPAVPVRLEEHPTPDFLAIVRARKESLPDAAMSVLTDVPAVRFAEVRDDDGSLLAITRGAVVEDWLHIATVEVLPVARRRGLAVSAYQALAQWATTIGARRAFLQVEERNEAAVALYARLGFTTHHTYVTYNRP